MPCSWEGNRRSGALAMHHRLQCFICLPFRLTDSLLKGDEHASLNLTGDGTLYLCNVADKSAVCCIRLVLLHRKICMLICRLHDKVLLGHVGVV